MQSSTASARSLTSVEREELQADLERLRRARDVLRFPGDLAPIEGFDWELGWLHASEHGRRAVDWWIARVEGMLDE